MRKKRETKYVTIKDVAKKADVSIATVSRVLNNGKVGADRKIRVLNAMNDLNYMPNNSARNLASVNATKRVSCVTPNLEPFYIRFIEGFKSGLQLYKYEGVIETYYGDMKTFEEICQRQESNSEVRGIVQFAPKKELLNKNVISMLEQNEFIEFIVDDQLKEKSIGLYFPSEQNINNFFNDVVFKNIETEQATEENFASFEVIITNHIDSAFALVNLGYTGTIRTIEGANNVSVTFPNIVGLGLDMYSLGVFVSRTIIKQINDEELENQSLTINIK